MSPVCRSLTRFQAFCNVRGLHTSLFSTFLQMDCCVHNVQKCMTNKLIIDIRLASPVGILMVALGLIFVKADFE